MPLVNVIVDEIPVQVPPGSNVIEAAKKAGVEIPHYCYHPRLPIAGNCRMCLVEVGTPKMTPEKKPEIGPDGKPVIMFQPSSPEGLAPHSGNRARSLRARITTPAACLARWV